MKRPREDDDCATQSTPRKRARYPPAPLDSPTNPFGRKHVARLVRSLPRPTSFRYHLPLRFQLVRLPGTDAPFDVHRVVQVPLSYTFVHLRCLVAFLFGGGSYEDDHVFNVLKDVERCSVKSGTVWAKLSTTRDPGRWREDEEEEEEAGENKADVEEEGNEGWEWKDEAEFTLGHAWPRGVDLARAIQYVHSKTTQVHISINTGMLERRAGTGNTPHVFSARGRAYLDDPSPSLSPSKVPLPRTLFSPPGSSIPAKRRASGSSEDSSTRPHSQSTYSSLGIEHVSVHDGSLQTHDEESYPSPSSPFPSPKKQRTATNEHHPESPDAFWLSPSPTRSYRSSSPRSSPIFMADGVGSSVRSGPSECDPGSPEYPRITSLSPGFSSAEHRIPSPSPSKKSRTSSAFSPTTFQNSSPLPSPSKSRPSSLSLSPATSRLSSHPHPHSHPHSASRSLSLSPEKCISFSISPEKRRRIFSGGGEGSAGGGGGGVGLFLSRGEAGLFPRKEELNPRGVQVEVDEEWEEEEEAGGDEEQVEGDEMEEEEVEEDEVEEDEVEEEEDEGNEDEGEESEEGEYHTAHDLDENHPFMSFEHGAGVGSCSSSSLGWGAGGSRGLVKNKPHFSVEHRPRFALTTGSPSRGTAPRKRVGNGTPVQLGSRAFAHSAVDGDGEEGGEGEDGHGEDDEDGYEEVEGAEGEEVDELDSDGEEGQELYDLEAREEDSDEEEEEIDLENTKDEDDCEEDEEEENRGFYDYYEEGEEDGEYEEGEEDGEDGKGEREDGEGEEEEQKIYDIDLSPATSRRSSVSIPEVYSDDEEYPFVVSDPLRAGGPFGVPGENSTADISKAGMSGEISKADTETGTNGLKAPIATRIPENPKKRLNPARWNLPADAFEAYLRAYVGVGRCDVGGNGGAGVGARESGSQANLEKHKGEGEKERGERVNRVKQEEYGKEKEALPPGTKPKLIFPLFNPFQVFQPSSLGAPAKVSSSGSLGVGLTEGSQSIKVSKSTEGHSQSTVSQSSQSSALFSVVVPPSQSDNEEGLSQPRSLDSREPSRRPSKPPVVLFDDEDEVLVGDDDEGKCEFDGQNDDEHDEERDECDAGPAEHDYGYDPVHDDEDTYSTPGLTLSLSSPISPLAGHPPTSSPVACFAGADSSPVRVAGMESPVRVAGSVRFSGVESPSVRFKGVKAPSVNSRAVTSHARWPADPDSSPVRLVELDMDSPGSVEEVGLFGEEEDGEEGGTSARWSAAASSSSSNRAYEPSYEAPEEAEPSFTSNHSYEPESAAEPDPTSTSYDPEDDPLPFPFTSSTALRLLYMPTPAPPRKRAQVLRMRRVERGIERSLKRVLEEEEREEGKGKEKKGRGEKGKGKEEGDGEEEEEWRPEEEEEV